MSLCGIELPHYCGNKQCDTNVSGTDTDVFCNAPHPTTVHGVPVARCRRQSHTSGAHAAFTFGVREPERWS